MDRLWSKVQPTGFCWYWIGTISQGYGILWLSRGKQRLAHRLVYEALIGPIPEGLVLDHLCRNTRCVNPDHLEPVTQAENTRRGKAILTHCKRGHAFTEENTRYAGPNKVRECRICMKMHNDARPRKNRQEVWPDDEKE